jgi:hypothetical protein
MIDRYNIKCLLTILLSLFMIIFSAEAQVHFSSERIKEIYEMLPDQSKKEIQNKVPVSPANYYFEVNKNGNKNKIIYRFNEFKELEQLGLYIINDSLQTTSIHEVVDFIERVFLVSFLQEDKVSLIREINAKKMEVLFNGYLINENSKNSDIASFTIRPDTPFRLKYDSKLFTFQWNLNSSNVLMVKIPNNYSLITEKTKDELEKDLLRKLKISL